MTVEPLKILVAAARPTERDALQRALAESTLDLDVNDANARDLAMAALTSGTYDCAFFDTGLTHEGGVDTLGELYHAGIDTPIIMIDGERPEATMIELLEAGAADCLKPSEISADRLSRSLLGAIRTSRAEKQAAEAEAKLTHLSIYDPLTALPNRALFLDRLDQGVALSKRENRQVAVLMMDLNGFREVNATLGHAVGDELLAEVAKRLLTVTRESDTLARIGGDEFAELLPSGATGGGAIKAAERAIEALNDPLTIQGHRLATGISIGIAVFPTHGNDASTLMRHADTAMFAAKRNATGYAVYFGQVADGDDETHVRQLSLSGDLRHAIRQNELVLNYQPKVTFTPPHIAGVEALLRWNHPQHGLVTPDVFIPLAEQTGIIEPLTGWVLDAALQQYREWLEAGLDIPVSVNLSPVTLHDRSFSDQIARLLEKWRVPARGLVLEITESAIISDVARATETVDKLHEMGVRISIDDFGTGYSSLAYIRRLRVSEIKVDKSFVLNMREINDDAVIVRSIVDLGRNLGLSVVAEGIEDIETWKLLEDLQCTEAQGYFISRPMDAASLKQWTEESAYGNRQGSD
ncbi:MAG TPA: GGDEF domain-containing response regulator [Alphaproteobacteria bacterium]|nr:GGDEF domain-containing response regulator [Alphaproteobacteria bacterium]